MNDPRAEIFRSFAESLVEMEEKRAAERLEAESRMGLIERFLAKPYHERVAWIIFVYATILAVSITMTFVLIVASIKKPE